MHLSQKRTEIVRGGSFEDLFSFLLFFLILVVSWAKRLHCYSFKSGMVLLQTRGKERKIDLRERLTV